VTTPVDDPVVEALRTVGKHSITLFERE